jgi:hypothetical protein
MEAERTVKEYMNGSHTPEEREDDPRLDGKMM